MLFDAHICCTAQNVSPAPFYHEYKSSTEEQMLLEVNTYSGEEIIPHIPLLQEWMKRDYIHYPYLWAAEECSMDLFIHEKSALVTIAKKEGQVVGVAAGMKYDAKLLEMYFEQPLSALAQQQGFNPSQILYMSFFLTAPECRNEKHLVAAIHHVYVEFAKKHGLQQLCYWTPLGNENYPLKPDEIVKIEPWGHAITGFKQMHIKFDQVWPTLQSDGSFKNETHSAVFYIKDLETIKEEKERLLYRGDCKTQAKKS